MLSLAEMVLVTVISRDGSRSKDHRKHLLQKFESRNRINIEIKILKINFVS